jgi:hypothetical protein
MLEGIESSLASRAFSNAATLACAAAPYHHEPVDALVLFEAPHVLAKLLGQVLLVLAFLDVRPIEPLHVATIEHRRHGTDGFEVRPDLLQQILLEDAGRSCGFVRVVFEDIPPAEHDVVQ